MAFHVLTSFFSALMKYSLVNDLFFVWLILSIRLFFSIILQAITLLLLVSIARYVLAKLPKPSILSLTEYRPSTTFNVWAYSIPFFKDF